MKRLCYQTTLLLIICSALLSFRLAPEVAARPQTVTAKPVRNVLVVTMDGMRWQEVFGGMTSELLTQKEGGVSDGVKAKIDARFGGPSPEARREKLMPFF